MGNEWVVDRCVIPAQEMGDCLPMHPPTRALILRELFQVWKNRVEVQPGVERGPCWGFQAWLALIQWVATLHAAGGCCFKAPSSPCCSCDAIRWLEERGFLASFLVSGKEVHGTCAVYMKQHRYFFFFLSKQVNYFSHNSSYKFSPNSFWLPIAAIFLSWFLPYSPVFPLPFQIPLTPTTAQLLSIPICFLQRILSSQNFDCFYLRTVFTDLVLS